MSKSTKWSRDELLLVFRLYCHTPFGRLHNRNPEIIQIAECIGRTANAVALKACNFASLDPAEQARGIRGMQNASRADRALWAEFEENSERIAREAEAGYELHFGPLADSPVLDTETATIGINDSLFQETVELSGPTETQRLVRTRRVQRFFRSAVLTSYDQRCAITGLTVPDLLNASHIIPWSVNESRRADPRNGLCLNALHDRAFDGGFLTIDEEMRVSLSQRLSRVTDGPALALLLRSEGQALELPTRFTPDPAALAFHRENVFH